MKLQFFLVLFLGLVRSFGIQKIILPNTTSIFTEKVPQSSMGITIDVNVVYGYKLFIAYGMKNRISEKTELAGTFRKTIELKEAGEFEVYILNGGDDFANISVSIYVDKAHEDTDEAEVLKKLLDKVRVDLMNIYNDVLKLKNANTQSLIKAKSAKSILWVICIFPGLYILLSYIRLNIIKGFFSSKSPHKI